MCQALDFSIADSNANCFGTQWKDRQGRYLAVRVSFTGSCSRCLICSLVPCHTLLKYSLLVRGCCVRHACCTRCCAMSAALAPSSCNQVYGRCAHHLIEQAHTPIPGLSNTHDPYATNKTTAVEAYNRRQHAPVGCMGKLGVYVWQGKIICQGSEATQKPCTHASTQAEQRPPTQNAA
jgi:hypothetical protein